jgi:hypothetical protein
MPFQCQRPFLLWLASTVTGNGGDETLGNFSKEENLMDAVERSDRLTATTGDRLQGERTSADFVAGGSFADALGGVATVILAIIGLAWAPYAYYLAAVAVIVLGCGLLLQSGSLVARYFRMLDEVTGMHGPHAELGGGVSAEFLGGLAGLVLGILAIVNVAGAVLLPVSVIVFGAALMLGAGNATQMNTLTVERWYGGHEAARRVAGSMSSAAAGAQLLVGVAGGILGIIALVHLGTTDLTLTLVALLCLGAGAAISSGAIGARMVSMVRR